MKTGDVKARPDRREVDLETNYFNFFLHSFFMLNEKDKEEILKWYDRQGRIFPWRETDLSPREALITEFLLQRTRAETVEDIWHDFFERYPDLETLNRTSEQELSDDLRGLGFQNRRARDIKSAVNILLEDRDGEIPDSEGELLELPGVGLYIANATLCFGFDQKKPIVDTNVKKVLEYLFDLEVEDDLRKDDKVWDLAARNLPDQDFKKFNWALLDLGTRLKDEVPEVLMRIREGS